MGDVGILNVTVYKCGNGAITCGHGGGGVILCPPMGTIIQKLTHELNAKYRQHSLCTLSIEAKGRERDQ